MVIAGTMGSSIVRGKYVLQRSSGLGAGGVIENGALVIDGDEIVDVGPFEQLKHRNDPRLAVLGSDKHLVMPGLINSHFHVGITPFQLGAEDLPLELWGLARLGRKRVDPYLDHLYGAIRMIESGTTTAQVLHYGGRGAPPISVDLAQRVLRAYDQVGLRVAYGMSVVDQNGIVGNQVGGDAEFAAILPPDLARNFRELVSAQYQSADEFTPKFEQLSRLYDAHPLIRMIVTPSSAERCSDKLLTQLGDLADAYGTTLHIHVQETVYQKAYGLARWGTTPLRHLESLSFLGPNVTCGHAVWFTDEDIEVASATGVRVCHNPSSNLRLHAGIAPVTRFLEAGIPVCLGSDEAGINDDHDMFQEMRLALTLHRRPDAEGRPTASQIFDMATVNAAAGTPFADQIGTLEIGRRADVVLLRLDAIEEPYVDPVVSLIDLLVRRARASDVDTVIIGGKIVMRDRQLIGVDREAVVAELRSTLEGRPSKEQRYYRRLAGELEAYMRQFLGPHRLANGEPHYRYNVATDIRRVGHAGSPDA